MPDQSQLPHQFNRRPPAAALIRAATFQPRVDEDIALGCECADPALQIERWGQEAVPLTAQLDS